MGSLTFDKYGAAYHMDCLLDHDVETSGVPSSVTNSSDMYRIAEGIAKNRNNTGCNRYEFELNSISNNGNTIHYMVDSKNDKMLIDGQEKENTNMETVDCESNNIYMPQFTSIFKLGFYRPDNLRNNNDSMIFVKPTDKVQKFENLRADSKSIYGDNKQSKRKFLNFIAYLDGDKYNNDSMTGSLHKFNKDTGNIELIDCVIDKENKDLDDKYIFACDMIAAVSGSIYEKANTTQERLIRSAAIGEYIETSYCYYILKSHYDSLYPERQKTLITKFYINYKTNQIYIKFRNTRYLLYAVSLDEDSNPYSRDDILASYTDEQKASKTRSLLDDEKKTLQLCNKFFITAEQGKGSIEYPLTVVPILKQKYNDDTNHFAEVPSKVNLLSNLDHSVGSASIEGQSRDVAVKECGKKCLENTNCTGYNIRQAKNGDSFTGENYLCHLFNDKYDITKDYSGEKLNELFSKDEDSVWDINTSFNYIKKPSSNIDRLKTSNQCKYIDHSNVISFDSYGNVNNVDEKGNVNIKESNTETKYTDKYLVEGNVGHAFNAFGSYIIEK